MSLLQPSLVSNDIKPELVPNPDYGHRIKGSNFEPWDEHNKWIKCPTSQIWFKNNDILAVHNCYITANPKTIEVTRFLILAGKVVGPLSGVDQPPPRNFTALIIATGLSQYQNWNYSFRYGIK